MIEAQSGSGIVTIPSKHSVDQTILNLQHILREKGITLFALIDHSGEATKAGMHMPNTKLLLFGSPTAGTPIMLAKASTGLDLPLKLLVTEDPGGATWVSWNDPAYLQMRHGFAHELLLNVSGVAALAHAAAE